ncbi:MAG: ParB/RepB/Spo0J family partition protein [Candidatus Eisenbacteria bacterium]
MHRKALGKGLEALIPGATATETLEPKSTGVRQVPIEEIGANPFQPRTRFNDEALKELSDSIRVSGILQPVIIRRNASGVLELVAGERRLRAAKLAGLVSVPAIFRDVDDREMMELALIENLQREDLNAIDEAKAYQTLQQKLGLTHDQISERVGKQRSSITNTVRLLLLPLEVQEMVSRGTLSAGHARALLALDASGDRLATARYVVAKGFSVRRTEAFINRRLRRQHSRPKAARLDGLTEWVNKLQQRFATRVEIRPGRKGGRVEFEYYSQEDLERLLEMWGLL